jgi:hypothetical protein
MALATMPIVLAAGLDRATGAAAVQPAYAVDAENLYARDAKLALRPGLAGTGYPALPWGTDVCCVSAARVTGDVLFVLFDRTSRQVRIYRLNPQLNLLQPVGTDGIWGTLAPDAGWPVVLAAENDGHIFFAHDEATLPFRLPTVYVTPDIDNPNLPGSLTTLTADLDGDGVESPVYFRGVVAYLEYMCGWGWGSEQLGEEDRGDVLRLSQPAEPTRFIPESFAICGARKEPILACLPVQGVLAVGKPTEAYRLVGQSPADFRVELLDARYGVIASRTAVAVGSIGFWCSQDGPRVVYAEGTEPIAKPLELVSPLPQALPPRGPDRTAFVVYDRDRYTLEWLWPNLDTAALRTTGFLLSRWNPEQASWTFTVREQCVSCAGEVVFSDAVQGATIDAYASNVVATDTAIAADTRFRRIEVSWDNNLALGNETVQLFLKVAGGSWNIALSVPVVGAGQSAALDTALPVSDYEVAIRMTRLGGTTAGYEGNDPDAWTAATAPGAKALVTTTSAAVAWTGGSFVSNSAPVVLTWASAQVGVPYLLEKDAGAGWVTVAADLVATSYSYTIPAPELGTTVDFRVTAQRGSIVGPTAGVRSVVMDIIVPSPAWLSATFSPSTAIMALSWTSVAASQYQLESSPDGVAWSARGTFPQSTTSAWLTPTSAELTAGQLFFRIRGVSADRFGPFNVTGPVAIALNLPAPVPTAAAITLFYPYATFVGALLRVDFTPPGGDVTRVRLEYSTNNGASWIYATEAGPSAGFVQGSVQWPGSPVNVTPFTLLYRLQSQGGANFPIGGGVSAPEPVTASTPIPVSVYQLSAVGSSASSSITITGTSPSTPLVGTGVVLQESTNGGATWTQIGQWSGIPTTISVTRTAAGSPTPLTYSYRAVASYGPVQGISNVQTATYYGPPSHWTPLVLAPPTITSLGFSLIGSPSTLDGVGSVSYFVGLPSGADGYEADFSFSGPSGPWTPSGNQFSNVIIPVPNAQLNTTVYIRVRAIRAGVAPSPYATGTQATSFTQTRTITSASISGGIIWTGGGAQVAFYRGGPGNALIWRSDIAVGVPFVPGATIAALLSPGDFVAILAPGLGTGVLLSNTFALSS